MFYYRTPSDIVGITRESNKNVMDFGVRQYTPSFRLTCPRLRKLKESARLIKPQSSKVYAFYYRFSFSIIPITCKSFLICFSLHTATASLFVLRFAKFPFTTFRFCSLLVLSNFLPWKADKTSNSF